MIVENIFCGCILSASLHMMVKCVSSAITCIESTLHILSCIGTLVNLSASCSKLVKPVVSCAK